MEEIKTHSFEINLTRLPHIVTPDMRVDKKVYWHSYNIAQRRTYLGLVKFFVDGFKIPRGKLTDDDVQIISVKGTKEFCDEILHKIEGLDSKEITEFTSTNYNRPFFQKIKYKIKENIESLHSSSWETFKASLASGGIIITLSVQPIVVDGK